MSRDFHRKFQLILKLAESRAFGLVLITAVMFRRAFGLMIIYDFVFQQSFSIHLQCVKPSKRRNSNLTCIFFPYEISLYQQLHKNPISLHNFSFWPMLRPLFGSIFHSIKWRDRFLVLFNGWHNFKKATHESFFCHSIESASSGDHQLFYYKINWLCANRYNNTSKKSSQHKFGVWQWQQSCRFKIMTRIQMQL